MNDWIEENWGLLLVGGIVVFAVSTQMPQIKYKIANQQVATDLNRLQDTQNQIAAQKTIVMEEGKKIANGRYDAGCEVIVDLDKYMAKKPIAEAWVIKQGQGIVSAAHAKQFRIKPAPSYYIGRDITVCDLYGTTAITEFDPKLGYAVAGSVAVTNDRNRMQAARNRTRVNRPDLGGG